MTFYVGEQLEVYNIHLDNTTDRLQVTIVQPKNPGWRIVLELTLADLLDICGKIGDQARTLCDSLDQQLQQYRERPKLN